MTKRELSKNANIHGNFDFGHYSLSYSTSCSNSTITSVSDFHDATYTYLVNRRAVGFVSRVFEV